MADENEIRAKVTVDISGVAGNIDAAASSVEKGAARMRDAVKAATVEMAADIEKGKTATEAGGTIGARTEKLGPTGASEAASELNAAKVSADAFRNSLEQLVVGIAQMKLGFASMPQIREALRESGLSAEQASAAIKAYQDRLGEVARANVAAGKDLGAPWHNLRAAQESIVKSATDAGTANTEAATKAAASAKTVAVTTDEVAFSQSKAAVQTRTLQTRFDDFQSQVQRSGKTAVSSIDEITVSQSKSAVEARTLQTRFADFQGQVQRSGQAASTAFQGVGSSIRPAADGVKVVEEALRSLGSSALRAEGYFRAALNTIREMGGVSPGNIDALTQRLQKLGLSAREIEIAFQTYRNGLTAVNTTTNSTAEQIKNLDTALESQQTTAAEASTTLSETVTNEASAVSTATQAIDSASSSAETFASTRQKAAAESQSFASQERSVSEQIKTTQTEATANVQRMEEEKAGYVERFVSRARSAITDWTTGEQTAASKVATSNQAVATSAINAANAQVKGQQAAGAAAAATAAQVSTSGGQIAASLKAAGMSVEEIKSGLINLGFSAKEAGAAMQEAGIMGEEAATKIKYSFLQARVSAQLLGDILVGGGPTSMMYGMSRLLATSATAGPILQAAFPIVGAAAFLYILTKIPDAIDKIRDWLAGWNEEAKRVFNEQVEESNKLITAYLGIERARAQAAGAALTVPSMRTEKEIEALGHFQTKLADVQRVINKYTEAVDAAGKMGEETVTRMTRGGTVSTKIEVPAFRTPEVQAQLQKALDDYKAMAKELSEKEHIALPAPIDFKLEAGDKSVRDSLLNQAKVLRSEVINQSIEQVRINDELNQKKIQRNLQYTDEQNRLDEAYNTAKKTRDEATLKHTEEMQKQALQTGKITLEQYEIDERDNAVRREKIEEDFQRRKLSILERDKDKNVASIAETSAQIAALQTNLQTELIKIDEKGLTQRTKIAVEKLDEQYEAAKAGSQERIDIIQKEIDVVVASYGKQGDEYGRLMKKMAVAVREFGDAEQREAEKALEIWLKNAERQAAISERSAEQRVNYERYAQEDLYRLQNEALARKASGTSAGSEQITGVNITEMRKALDEELSLEQSNAKALESFYREEADAKVSALEKQISYYQRAAELETDPSKQEAYLAKIEELKAREVQANDLAADQIMRIHRRMYESMEKDASKEADAEIRERNKVSDAMLRQENFMIFQAKSTTEALVKLWQSVVQKLTDEFLKMVNHWIIDHLLMSSHHRQTTQQQIVQTQIAENQQNAATKAGQTQQTLAVQSAKTQQNAAIQHQTLIVQQEENRQTLIVRQGQTQQTVAVQTGQAAETAATEAGQSAQAASTAASQTAQTATTATNSAQRQAITIQSSLKAIFQNAKEAATSAFKWVMKEVPFPANAILAPAAAAAAFAGTMAFAEGGYDVPGRPGSYPTVLHPAEMVLPRPLAEGVRGMVDKGNQTQTVQNVQVAAAPTGAAAGTQSRTVAQPAEVSLQQMTVSLNKVSQAAPHQLESAKATELSTRQSSQSYTHEIPVTRVFQSSSLTTQQSTQTQTQTVPQLTAETQKQTPILQKIQENTYKEGHKGHWYTLGFAEGGIVPHDMPAMVHAKEMVLPPRISAGMIDLISSGHTSSATSDVNRTINERTSTAKDLATQSTSTVTERLSDRLSQIIRTVSMDSPASLSARSESSSTERLVERMSRLAEVTTPKTSTYISKSVASSTDELSEHFHTIVENVLPKFDTGALVTKDMPANLHAGEAVLPPHIASGLLELTKPGSSAREFTSQISSHSVERLSGTTVGPLARGEVAGSSIAPTSTYSTPVTNKAGDVHLHGGLVVNNHSDKHSVTEQEVANMIKSAIRKGMIGVD